MIGLAGLVDGGHYLEHPTGAIYVRVRRHHIVYAEFGSWGDPALISWKAGRPPLSGLADELRGVLTAGEVVPAV